ncbi:FecR family protein [Marinilabilia salmonicolor]|uniref:FecR family protein n=1 Tax=Marinilabilia salmonicolor TaxID=989 RepID=UPI00029AB592|nr:FecR family protein [Marinilabilia salmonicolor]
METLRPINADLLVRYFSGDCTSAEIRQIEDWRSESAENKQYLEDFKQVWDADYQSMLSGDLLSRDWNAIRERINFPGKKREIGIFTAFSRIAAAVIVMLAVSSAVYVYWNVPGFGRWSAFQTGEQIDSLRLPDNSIVYLNNYSSLKYLKNFEDGKRTVSLDGEGFFEVTHDTGNPFLVKSPEGVDVEVLGTAFHLQTGEGLDKMELNVTEGSVAIQYRRHTKKVLAGNSAVVQNRELMVAPIKDDNFLAWKTGELKFSQCPLDKIAKILKNHYKEINDVKINTQSDVLVTTSFRNQNIKEVLDELAIHFDKKFILNGGVLIISE